MGAFAAKIHSFDIIQAFSSRTPLVLDYSNYIYIIFTLFFKENRAESWETINKIGVLSPSNKFCFVFQLFSEKWSCTNCKDGLIYLMVEENIFDLIWW